MSPSMIAMAATALALFTAAAQAEKCWVQGLTFTQDRPVSGGSGTSNLYMYKGKMDEDHIIATYKGDYDPNCCIGSNRETDFHTKLPKVFKYTAMMQSSGLELKGCKGTYGDQKNIPGALNTKTSIDFGSSLTSSCVITFDC